GSCVGREVVQIGGAGSHGGAHRSSHIGAQDGDGVIVTAYRWKCLDAGTAGDGGWWSSRDGYLPDVAAVDVILVRGIDCDLAIRAECEGLDFEIARSQKDCSAA